MRLDCSTTAATNRNTFGDDTRLDIAKLAEKVVKYMIAVRKYLISACMCITVRVCMFLCMYVCVR